MPWLLFIVVALLIVRVVISVVSKKKMGDAPQADVFLDIPLTIKKHYPRNGYIIFDLETTKQKDAGIEVGIKETIYSGIRNNSLDMSTLERNGFWIKSKGSESDTFLKELSSAWGFPTNKSFNQKAMSGDIFLLSEDDFNLTGVAEKPYHFKIFIALDTALYAEFFFDIDLKKQMAQLAEKDTEYRENIIKNFSN